MQNHKPHFALTENSPTEPTVTEAYRDLNKAIDDMDKKVEHVIKKHEAQFLYAYRNHISKIKKQLAQIKHKSQQQQKMFSSNDRIQYLQKQMIIFREQALKLYAKLDEKTQQNQYYKNRIKQLQKEHHNIVSNQKEQIKTSKLEEMNKGILQNKIQQLQQILKSKDQLIARYNAKIQGLKEESLRRSQFDNKDHRLGSITSSLKKGSQSQRYSARKQLIVHDSQMKQWFLQCIKTVKRQVVMRNNNHNMMDLSHINSIQQFKTLDKLRLLEVFLQNEKLLTWMYQRIFPDRLSKLRSNLSAYQSAKIERPTQQLSMIDIQKNMLPKVNKLGKSDYRNNIIIKNGKLNISMT